MKIGRSPRGADTRAVWVDGGIHAREWVAISTSTFLLDKLINVFKTGEDTTCNVKVSNDVMMHLSYIDLNQFHMETEITEGQTSIDRVS